MSDDEKQAIELLRTIKRPTLATGFERQTNLLKAIEIVLDLIEQQQDKIKEREMTLATYTAQTLNTDIKQMNKHKDDLEMLYKGCQIELEEKDKIIDEMAKWLYEEDNLFGFGIFKEINTPEKIKEYFKKKVEDK